MQTLNISLPEKIRAEYPIYLGIQCQDWIAADLVEKKIGNRYVIISDQNTSRLNGSMLCQKLLSLNKETHLIEVPQGEKSKSIFVFADLLNQLKDLHIQRTDCIIALGGGVIGDLAGFTAGCYLRGINYVQVPTTLLAQVDSSVGGKVAINISKGKNYCGLFYQPRAVYIDLQCLRTLPDIHIKSGLAEVVKTAMIWDAKLFSFLEDNYRELLDVKLDPYLQVVGRCCEIKSLIVQEDEKEFALRKVLNYGHTLGHALEEYYEHDLLHGQCVAWGMQKEARLSHELDYLSQNDLSSQNSLLQAMGLIPDIPPPDPERFYPLLFADKKNQGQDIVFALPESIGKMQVLGGVPKDLILSVL